MLEVPRRRAIATRIRVAMQKIRLVWVPSGKGLRILRYAVIAVLDVAVFVIFLWIAAAGVSEAIGLPIVIALFGVAWLAGSVATGLIWRWHYRHEIRAAVALTAALQTIRLRGPETS